jgi:putative membrane protein
MFAWTTQGRNIFRKYFAEFFDKTKALATNQVLYNGFLADGLIWTFLISNEIWRTNILFLFSGCFAIAGICAALTEAKKIFFKQALPAF